MASIRLDFSNRNSQRAYPIEEWATRTADDGRRLPDNALTAVKVRFPDNLGERVCLGGITISPTISTVTLVATTAAFSDPVPIGCLSVSAPIQVGRPYPITPLYPGVSGWVAFGDLSITTTTVQSWKFSDHSEVPVIPSEAKSYEELPIAAAGKWGLSTTLTGLVSLAGEGPLIIEGADVDLGDGAERVIRFRMDLVHDPSLLYAYAGPCGGRPESQTCDFTPISNINAVVPDSNGNIEITFEEPFVATIDALLPRMSIDFPVGLEDACGILKELTRPSPGGDIPGLGYDICGEDPFYSIPGS